VTGKILTVAAYAAFFWAVVFPRPYHAVLLVNVAVVVMAYALVLSGRGGLSGGKVKLGVPLLMPGLALAWRMAADVRLVSHAASLGIAVIGAAVLAGVIALGDPAMRSRSRFAVLLVLQLPLAFGAALYANTALEASAPQTFEATIVDKHFSRGRLPSTYQLTLSPWGPREKTETDLVPRAVYDSVKQGERVHIMLYAGRLGVAWFTIAP
jgi:hypothetical protein